MVVLLGRSLAVAAIQQQLATQTMQLGLGEPLLGPLNDLRRLSEMLQSVKRLPEHGTGLGDPHEQHRPN
jgi:hypothetical protein